jgi:hypothetical protein
MAAHIYLTSIYRLPVPAVGVHDGASLAGNDSSEALWTMSFERQP